MKNLKRPYPWMALALVLLWTPTGLAADREAWERFKNDFIARDGRVVDFLQKGISHSEGQGYAMLLGVAYDDPETFRRCWKWAVDNLQVRRDGLFAWSWGERFPGDWGVIDLNNASDGDQLIAYAAFLGAKKWKDDRLRDKALEILQSIRTKLVVKRDNRLFLLPGYYGFLQDNGMVLNPGYMIFPAFSLFARHENPGFWKRLHRDSLETLAACTFTRLKLPADWVLWNGRNPSLFSKRSDRFGYEAIRVLLYLAWDNALDSLPGTRDMLDFIQRAGYVPRDVDLAGSSVSLDDASAGFYAVYARAAASLNRTEQSHNLWEEARKKMKKESGDYYSHVLYLLAQIQP